jgi:hypothetical protein
MYRLVIIIRKILNKQYVYRLDASGSDKEQWPTLANNIWVQ